MRITTITDTWNPGTVADGASTSKTVTLIGCDTSQTALCTLGITPLAGLHISAQAGAALVRINVRNDTGGDWTPGVMSIRVAAIRFDT